MNSRQRVHAALAGHEPDRVPIDLGGTLVTSITMASYRSLMAHLGLDAGTPALFDHVQQLPYLPETLLERLGADVRPVCVPPALATAPALIDEGAYWGWIDPWGSKLRMPKSGGLYFDWVEHPLAELTDDLLDKYQWPPFESEANLAAMRDRAVALRRDTDYALAGTANISGGIFEQACRTVGTEEFLMAMLTDRTVAERLLEELTEYYIEAATRQLDVIGEFLDVVQYGDDLASQLTWLISPESYVSMVKPRQRRLFDAIKSRTRAKILFHSCGAAFDIIPHLIEIGADILNPVQISARGMDPARLKSTYGRDIVFWGGGVDTQAVLPFGSPDEVREQVRHLIDVFAPGGGFVWSVVHNVQAGVPPENILAAFDTVLEAGAG